MPPFSSSSSLSLNDNDDEEEVYEPLLGRNHNINKNNNNKRIKLCIKFLGSLYCFYVILFFLIAITSIIDLLQPSELTLLNDISIIPNQYHLQGIGKFLIHLFMLKFFILINTNKM
jgi:hypothetical protein